MKQLTPAVKSSDHIEGNNMATIELVEYGDYQCPHCGHAYPIIKNIQQELGAELKFVFRNFPLSKIHPYAFIAATAAEAAALQDKFWEMHDIIFENQASLNFENILEYADRIGLDIDRLRYDMMRNEIEAKVEQDFESGIRSGVNGTPSFFINGERYNGSWEQQELLDYLKEMTGKVSSQDKQETFLFW